MNVFNGGKPPDDIRPTGAISGLRNGNQENMDYQENDPSKVVKISEKKNKILNQTNR